MTSNPPLPLYSSPLNVVEKGMRPFQKAPSIRVGGGSIYLLAQAPAQREASRQFWGFFSLYKVKEPLIE